MCSWLWTLLVRTLLTLAFVPFRMDDYDKKKLPLEPAVIFIAATTGQGEAPDTMKARLDKITGNVLHFWFCPSAILEENCAFSTVFLNNAYFLLQSFWRFLLRKGLPTGILTNVKCAVFGLGDSTYVKFNAAAKMLAKRLRTLGAQMLVDTGLGWEWAASNTMHCIGGRSVLGWFFLFVEVYTYHELWSWIVLFFAGFASSSSWKCLSN